MLNLFCCCFFFKLATKDLVLLLLKLAGFGLGRLGDLQMDATPRVPRCSRRHLRAGDAKVAGSHLRLTQNPRIHQHQRAETSPGEAGVTQAGCCSHLLVTVRCMYWGAGRQGVMARAIPTREIKKNNGRLCQQGEEAWLLRLSSLFLGRVAVGQAGRGEGAPCPSQPGRSAGTPQQHPARIHLRFWGVLIVVKGCKSKGEEKLALCYVDIWIVKCF